MPCTVLGPRMYKCWTVAICAEMLFFSLKKKNKFPSKWFSFRSNFSPFFSAFSYIRSKHDLHLYVRMFMHHFCSSLILHCIHNTLVCFALSLFFLFIFTVINFSWASFPIFFHIFSFSLLRVFFRSFFLNAKTLDVVVVCRSGCSFTCQDG